MPESPMNKASALVAFAALKQLSQSGGTVVTDIEVAQDKTVLSVTTQTWAEMFAALGIKI